MLKLLYEENQNTLRFLAERNWDAMKYTTTGIIGITAISAFSQNTFTVLFILLLALAATAYLVKSTSRHTDAVKNRERIEKALQLLQSGAYLPDGPLLKFESKFPSWLGSGSFIAAIWIIAITGIFVVVSGALQGWDEILKPAVK